MVSALSTALSGAVAQATRLSSVASNIANQASTGAMPGPGGTVPAGQPTAYQAVTTGTVSQGPTGGGVRAVTTLANPATVALADASSPYANAEGLVSAPNVDVTQQTVTMIDARRAYSANFAVVRAQDSMTRQALNLSA